LVFNIRITSWQNVQLPKRLILLWLLSLDVSPPLSGDLGGNIFTMIWRFLAVFDLALVVGKRDKKLGKKLVKRYFSLCVCAV
jgi:K+-transporting ATPase A subunit